MVHSVYFNFIEIEKLTKYFHKIFHHFVIHIFMKELLTVRSLIWILFSLNIVLVNGKMSGVLLPLEPYWLKANGQ